MIMTIIFRRIWIIITIRIRIIITIILVAFFYSLIGARGKRENANDSKASSFYNKHIQKYSWRFDAYGNKSIVSVWKEVKKSIFELQLPVGWFGLSE